jgi:cellulose synthase/poly-beta-1,6-N-acetylglucosamine synthase-like glycosyltransferase
MKIVPNTKKEPQIQSIVDCSIGIMAYNEEANIGQLLKSLLDQKSSELIIKNIIVVASGCTDKTESIAYDYASRNPKIEVLVQHRREGKAAAVNLFLHHAQSDILVLESADTLPESMAIERLLSPFTDSKVGMTGGHPIPVNNCHTFMGFAVHLLWSLHHQIGLRHPKLGEMIAFRRIFSRIPPDSAVDEASIELLIRGQGYDLRYVPEAIVYNRGAETVGDFLKQRRRIHAGHLRMRHQQGYGVSTMHSGRIIMALLRTWQWDWRYLFWTPAVIGLEIYGRLLGWVDFRLRKQDHAVWDVAETTKKDISL